MPCCFDLQVPNEGRREHPLRCPRSGCAPSWLTRLPVCRPLLGRASLFSLRSELLVCSGRRAFVTRVLGRRLLPAGAGLRVLRLCLPGTRRSDSPRGHFLCSASHGSRRGWRVSNATTKPGPAACPPTPSSRRYTTPHLPPRPASHVEAHAPRAVRSVSRSSCRAPRRSRTAGRGDGVRSSVRGRDRAPAGLSRQLCPSAGTARTP